MDILSLTTGLMGLTTCRMNGPVTSGKQAGLSMCLLETGGVRSIVWTDLGGGSTELVQSIAWNIGECVATLKLVLLTAALTSCLSSFLVKVSPSSSDNKGPEGSRRTGGGILDSVRAVSSMGESQLELGLSNLLTSGKRQVPGINR